MGLLGEWLGLDPKTEQGLGDMFERLAAAKTVGMDLGQTIQSQHARDAAQQQFAENQKTNALNRRLLTSQADEADRQAESRKAYIEALKNFPGNQPQGGGLLGPSVSGPSAPPGAAAMIQQAMQPPSLGAMATGGPDPQSPIPPSAMSPPRQMQAPQQGAQQTAQAQGGMAGMPVALQAQLWAAQQPGVDPAMAQQALKAAVEWKNSQPKFSPQNILGHDAQGNLVQYSVNDQGQAMAQPFLPAEKLQNVNLGNRMLQTGEYSGKPIGAAMPIGQSPDSAASNALGYARLGQEARQFNQNFGKPQIVTTDQGVFAVDPRNPLSASPVMGGTGQLGKPASGVKDAQDALALIDQAGPLIQKSTGSYAGRGLDFAARAFGKTTEGDRAAAQLSALEGALIAKMPKMSGPQSDKDVAMYRQMAGNIGDPTVPAEIKQASMQTLREIQQRYAGQNGSPATQTGAPIRQGGQVMTDSPQQASQKQYFTTPNFMMLPKDKQTSVLRILDQGTDADRDALIAKGWLK